jgi:hypothetical protein
MNKLHWSAKKNFFPLPVKVQGDSYSLDIAESEYDNQIALSPTNFKEGRTVSKSMFLIKKSNMLVFN